MSELDVPGACVKTLSITLALLAGVCWRSVTHCCEPLIPPNSAFQADILVIFETGKVKAGFKPGGAAGVHDTDWLSLERERVPSFFL